MYNTIHGSIRQIKDGLVEIVCGGLGFKVRTNEQFSSEDARVGYLFIHMWVSEGAAPMLFGFSQERERDMFELLISVPGVGPNTAMSLLGMGLSRLIAVIYTGDLTSLVSVKGVGQKVAQQIVISLEKKVACLLPPTEECSADVLNYETALKSLLALGYKKSMAAQALDQVKQVRGGGHTAEALVTFALQHIK